MAGIWILIENVHHHIIFSIYKLVTVQWMFKFLESPANHSDIIKIQIIVAWFVCVFASVNKWNCRAFMKGTKNKEDDVSTQICCRYFIECITDTWHFKTMPTMCDPQLRLHSSFFSLSLSLFKHNWTFLIQAIRKSLEISTPSDIVT